MTFIKSVICFMVIAVAHSLGNPERFTSVLSDYTTRDAGSCICSGILWTPGNGGIIPPNAVYIDEDPWGGPTYVGRALIGTTLSPGRLVKRTGKFYVGYDRKAYVVSNFEVLTYIKPTEWRKVDTFDTLYEGAIHGGSSKNNQEFFVCRVLISANGESRYYAGKFLRGNRNVCHIPVLGKENSYYSDYEVLYMK